jgi:hypothetical protein
VGLGLGRGAPASGRRRFLAASTARIVAAGWIRRRICPTTRCGKNALLVHLDELSIYFHD